MGPVFAQPALENRLRRVRLVDRAYFDRRVDETEDQSEFVWAAITSGACANPAPYCNPPAPGPIQEIKSYQRASSRKRALRRSLRADPVRGRRVLLGFPWPCAVRIALPRLAGSESGQSADGRPAQQP